MPRALLENTPRRIPGGDLANRRCSERRAVGRPVSGSRYGLVEGMDFGPDTKPGRRGSAEAGRGTARWKGKAESACRECPNQPPDGTDAGVGPPGVESWPSRATGLCVTTGSERASQPGSIRPDATSITMLAPSVRWYARCSQAHHSGCVVQNDPGKSDRPMRPEPIQASVGPAAMSAPFVFGTLARLRTGASLARDNRSRLVP